MNDLLPLENLIVGKVLAPEERLQFALEKFAFFRELSHVLRALLPAFHDTVVLLLQVSVALLQFVVFRLELLVCAPLGVG